MKIRKTKHKKQKYKDFAYNPRRYKEIKRLRRITKKIHRKRKELLKR